MSQLQFEFYENGGDNNVCNCQKCSNSRQTSFQTIRILRIEVANSPDINEKTLIIDITEDDITPLPNAIWGIWLLRLR